MRARTLRSTLAAVVLHAACAASAAADGPDGRVEALEGPLGLHRPASRAHGPSVAPTVPLPAAAPAAPPSPAAVAAASPGTGDPLDPRIARLDAHLMALTMRRSNRVGDGLVPLLLGSTYVGLGVYANRAAGDGAGRFFVATGASSLASAAIHFGLASNPERAFTEFRALRDDPTAQIAFGERWLRRTARKRLSTRLLQGGIDLGITAATLPLLFGSSGFDSDDPVSWLVAMTGGLSVVNSVTTMARRSEEERRFRAYMQETSGDHATTSHVVLQFRGVGAVPTRDGAAVSVSYTF